MLQIRQQDRRFSLDEKIFALTLYKQGPRHYRLLERIFALPARTTLRRLLSTITLHTGINDGVYNQIKKINEM